MIVDKFSILGWDITVLYECGCEDTDFIIETLKDIHCPNKYLIEALGNTCDLNTGLTYSNLTMRSSVIVISKTTSFPELINTISHEYYHLMCHLAKGLEIDEEEDLARLCGNLNMRSYKIIEKLNGEVGS